jgi:quinone-modifying oxidoreductase subunit QmoC
MLEVKPDIKFKKQLRKISKASLNECMQCGTCSVVCSLAPDERPFPRKEMIWAGWGMKQNLMADTDVWLCHQCGDCSTYCPRGVKPSDVLAAIRQITYIYYARPRFMGVLLNKPVWLPVALLIPVVIIAAILMLAGTFTIPEGPVNYSRFFPHAWLNGSFMLITIFTYVMAFSGLIRFRNDLKLSNPGAKPAGNLISSLFSLRKQILAHTNFGSCSANKIRRWSHMLVFYGFILLLLVTAYAIFAAVTHRYPLGISNPFKILGNMAAVMLFTGLGIMIVNRLINKKNTGSSNYSDWLLLISMLLLTISGVVVEIARFQNWSLAYHLYFFHLVSVWFVIIYLPYTKFGHLLYRSVAMSFSESIGRKLHL